MLNCHLWSCTGEKCDQKTTIWQKSLHLVILPSTETTPFAMSCHIMFFLMLQVIPFRTWLVGQARTPNKIYLISFSITNGPCVSQAHRDNCQLNNESYFLAHLNLSSSPQSTRIFPFHNKPNTTFFIREVSGIILAIGQYTGSFKSLQRNKSCLHMQMRCDLSASCCCDTYEVLSSFTTPSSNFVSLNFGGIHLINATFVVVKLRHTEYCIGA